MLQVAETFEMQMDDDAASLKDIARLDTCVTVVDVASFMQHLQSVETLKVSNLPLGTPCLHSSGRGWFLFDTSSQMSRDVSERVCHISPIQYRNKTENQTGRLAARHFQMPCRSQAFCANDST